MDISRIRVNTDSLKSDAQSVADSINYIDKLLSDLEDDFNKLDAMWDGSANEAFRREYSSDIEGLRTVINNLRVFNRFENTAREKYDACEQSVGNIVASIKW